MVSPKNRKTKGKLFENMIANILHGTFYGKCNKYKQLYDDVGNSTLKPKRDSSSGTFKDSDGDIKLNLLKKFFPVSIECKHHKDMNFQLNYLLGNGCNSLFDIYDNQALINADFSGLRPLVVFKANFTNVFCLFDNYIFFISKINLFNNNYIRLRGHFTIMLFSDFLRIYIENMSKLPSIL